MQKYFYNLKSSNSYEFISSGRVVFYATLHCSCVGRCKGATTAAIASGVSFWPCQILILYLFCKEEEDRPKKRSRNSHNNNDVLVNTSSKCQTTK